MSRRGSEARASRSEYTARAFAAVAFPFWIGHRGEFAAIGACNKLEGFDGAIPGGARAVLLVPVLLLALGSSVVRRPAGMITGRRGRGAAGRSPRSCLRRRKGGAGSPRRGATRAARAARGRRSDGTRARA